MQYWQFRLTVYQRHLEAWLNTIKQAPPGWYIYFQWQYCFTDVAFIGTGCLGRLRHIHPAILSGIVGFLLLTHSWVILQKDGILATPL